ncbi:uncharacterized protein F54H12.2-like [Stegodyphus dumicola]|uniref:uncharacterized protein F54H12.2-like n=1 Tax=Stegodyphus dumicola TaxID=202533 RepID=UPI0015A7DD52|nr:uncharacterized protein F54H12.2-like [Stegodyphus dumicola]
MKPVSVTKENEKLAWKNLYGRIENPKSPRLKVGDIELQKVNDSGYYLVENVLKKRKLPSSINLNGEFEVGISEIIYPHSWHNINENNNLFGFDLGDGKTISRRIPAGYYETIPDLIKAIMIPDLRGKVEFNYNSVTKRVRVKTLKNTKIILTEGISEILGFEPTEIQGVADSPYVADPHASFPVIYVYSDIVEPQLVGDTQAPLLLRIVKVNGKDGEMVSAHYERPQYVPRDSPTFSDSGTNVSDGGPIEFHISGGEDYLDLSETHLYVKAKILNSDGSHLQKDAKVGPVNLFLHSLFSQIDVKLNERLITSSDNTYPYRALIETLLNHGYDTKVSQLTSELFYKDTPGHMNIDGNEGFNKRAECRLHLDLFHQERLLLNLVDVKLKLIRSKPEFCLMAENGDYKVALEHVSLFVRKVHVSPAVSLGHAKALEKGSAKYPIQRVLCKVFSIPQGNMSFVQDNVFVGQMPKRIIVACLDNDALNGNYKKSPFEFKHYHMNFIGVYVDGQPLPYNPVEPNFDQNNYIRAFQSLFLGTNREDRGIDISREDYAKGYTLFAFDLSPDLCDGEHFNLIRHSSLRLEVKFGVALEQTISVLVYAEFESVLEINKSRTVLSDF